MVDHNIYGKTGFLLTWGFYFLGNIFTHSTLSDITLVFAMAASFMTVRHYYLTDKKKK